MISCLILIIICATLNRLAGRGGFKGALLLRRLGIPLVIATWGLLNCRWLSILSLPLGFIVFTLPITLRGDDITKDWLNKLWIPILGILIGLIPSPLNFSLWWVCVPYSVIFSVLVILSNTKKTAEWFKWNVLELIFGGLIGFITYITSNLFLNH
jgi:hypothetical protein